MNDEVISALELFQRVNSDFTYDMICKASDEQKALYHGISGSGWSNASGIVKKFYLHKERDEDRYCIIEFSKEDFIAIDKGENFLQIIENKILSLRLDTDYTKYLSKHPAEK